MVKTLQSLYEISTWEMDYVLFNVKQFNFISDSKIVYSGSCYVDNVA